MFNIEEELKKLPGKPGVYIMHDKNDEIIYVGKAVSLKNRVRSYFRKTNKNRSERGISDRKRGLYKWETNKYCKALSTPEQTSEDGEEDRVVDIVDDNGNGRI